MSGNEGWGASVNAPLVEELLMEVAAPIVPAPLVLLVLVLVPVPELVWVPVPAGDSEQAVEDSATISAAFLIRGFLPGYQVRTAPVPHPNVATPVPIATTPQVFA